MPTYSIFVLKQGIVGIVLAFIPAIACWVANKNEVFIYKIKLIIPSILLLMCFIVMALVSQYTTRQNYEPFWWTYQIAIFIAFLSIMYSVSLHNGRGIIVLTHLLTILSAAYLWFIGGMALSHDWI
ncbi:MAG: hypothetical protein AB2728_18220 [Candidatus Thiodiazotropha sp.]|nr:hypothetical protein [Candidatus Thiodiazotropha sp. (ex Lucina pensylvanica)]